MKDANEAWQELVKRCQLPKEKRGKCHEVEGKLMFTEPPFGRCEDGSPVGPWLLGANI